MEFGLCKQEGQIRAYGAGLLSAFGELKHALSDKPDRKKFDPIQTALQVNWFLKEKNEFLECKYYVVFIIIRILFLE